VGKELPELPDSIPVDEELLITCGVCEKKSAIIIWDNRYSGFRGYCLICKNNWPES